MQDEESFIEKLKKDEVEFLQLQFTDISGSVKSLPYHITGLRMLFTTVLCLMGVPLLDTNR
jgi:L-glutamine synthetase (EC 6.3.1.2)